MMNFNVRRFMPLISLLVLMLAMLGLMSVKWLPTGDVAQAAPEQQFGYSQPVFTSTSPAYGFNNVPSLIYLHGQDLQPPVTVNLVPATGTNQMLNVTYNDLELVAAEVPAGLTPGFYDVTIQNFGGVATMPDAYEVLPAGGVDDLVSSEEWLWSNPFPLRVGYRNSSIGLLVQHLGGRYSIDEVTVEFRLDNPVSGQVIGRGLTNVLAPFATESTDPVFWEPETAGVYKVCAIIDPDNEVPEYNENNNVTCRDLTVLDIALDIVPPEVEEDSFMIYDNAFTTPQVTVTLDLNATDPGAQASGMFGIKYVEFEYILGAHRWVPVQRTDWIDYDSATPDFPWSLVRTYGMRYMQAWASDNAGNISLIPGVDVIDLLPSEQSDHVGQHGVVFYRVLLEEGDTFNVALTPEAGDPDLYVWGPNGQLWPSNSYVGPEQITFQAPTKGTYQIEVHGFTDADYRLNFDVTAINQSILSLVKRAGDKVQPPEPAVPLDEWPEFFDVDPPTPVGPTMLYLPIVTD